MLQFLAAIFCVYLPPELFFTPKTFPMRKHFALMAISLLTVGATTLVVNARGKPVFSDKAGKIQLLANEVAALKFTAIVRVDHAALNDAVQLLIAGHRLYHQETLVCLSDGFTAAVQAVARAPDHHCSCFMLLNKGGPAPGLPSLNPA